MKKVTDIRNIIAKTVGMVIGLVILISVFWGFIVQGFNLNTSDLKDWTRNDSILAALGFMLMFGAAYFNTLVELGVNFLSKFSK